MSIVEILLTGVGLAMDAFAVSICKGLSIKGGKLKKAIIIALYFGFFQALMPLIGYFLGSTFAHFITSIDHWVAFVLLALIGGNMIRESFGEEEGIDDSVKFKTMIMLAIATSIDALAVGVTFAFEKVNIALAVSLIGAVTFIIAFVGVEIGAKVGDKFGARAERIGGTVLVLLGLKILLEAYNLLPW